MPDPIRIHSPANGSFVGEVAVTPVDDVREVVARARAAQQGWAKTTFDHRRKVLLDVRQHLLENADAICDLLGKESGKPRHEALLHEVLEQLELITYFANEAERILSPEAIPLRLLKHRGSYIHRPPRGVIGIIGPWNFPMTIPFGSAVMALVSGNAAVVKPSEFTPLIAQFTRKLYVEAGVPADLLGVVYGYGDVGAALIDAGVDMIEFTGSVATGKKVAAMCGERLIPCVTELGGKAPALVLADADMERTLNSVLWGGFANAGQVCASIERLVVHEKVYDRFTSELITRVKALRVGDASGSSDVDVGPLVNERQRQIVERLVQDAVDKGARVACGGKRIDGPGHFYEPTVLLDVTTDMDIVNKETFGPVVPVMKRASDQEMVEEANRSHLGLLAYVFTKDVERGRLLAEGIEAGTVMVNDVLATHAAAETPWGGVKQSGVGHTHSDDGLRHMCQQRHVNYPILPWIKRELWNYPYDASALPMLKRGLAAVYGRGVKRFLKAG